MTNMMMDENLLKIFSVEAGENLDGFEDALIKLESDGFDASMVQEAFRLIHNIKGSAAMVGLTVLSNLAHAMEDRLDQIRKGKEELNPELINLLFQGTGLLHELLNPADADEGQEKAAAMIGLLRGEAPSQIRTAVAAPTVSAVPAVREVGNPGFSWDRGDLVHVGVEINENVVFKDVKAYLIKTNLLEVGTIAKTFPALDDDAASENTIFNFLLTSTADLAAIREKVERAAEIKQVSVEPVTAKNLNAVKGIYEKDAGETENAGATALRRWGDRSFSVIVHRISETTNVIKFNGEMDGDGVVTLLDIFQENPSLMGNIILDFSKLNYINSLGLGLLIRLYKNVREKGGRVRILAPTAPIKKLLDNTKISSLIPVIASADEGMSRG